MARIVNRSQTILRVHHWLITPISECIDRLGNVHDKLPNDVAYSDQAKYLADQGLLTIEGYTPLPAEIPAPVAREPGELEVTSEPETTPESEAAPRIRKKKHAE